MLQKSKTENKITNNTTWNRGKNRYFRYTMVIWLGVCIVCGYFKRRTPESLHEFIREGFSKKGLECFFEFILC